MTRFFFTFLLSVIYIISYSQMRQVLWLYDKEVKKDTTLSASFFAADVIILASIKNPSNGYHYTLVVQLANGKAFAYQINNAVISSDTKKILQALPKNSEITFIRSGPHKEEYQSLAIHIE